MSTRQQNRHKRALKNLTRLRHFRKTDVIFIEKLLSIIRLVEPEAYHKLKREKHNLALAKLRLEAIKLYKSALTCPNPYCANDGYTIDVDSMGSPEQIQCQFCYEEPNSKFNMEQNIRNKGHK